MSEYIEKIVPLLPGSPVDVMLAESPEIVRCRDCKFFDTDKLGEFCSLFNAQLPKQVEGFCKWGERRSE